MSSYLSALAEEFKDWRKATLITIFTLVRLVYGISWFLGSLEKLPWLTNGKNNSIGLIGVVVTNVQKSTITHGLDPLHLNSLLVWVAQHIFMATPHLTDLMVVFCEMAVGVVIILGFKIIWIALLAMFLNTQYMASGSANNFGYIWTNLGLMEFAKYAEAVGISGYLKARKGHKLIGDKLF